LKYLNFKKEIKTQELVEENGKILDLKKIKYIIGEFEEYEVLMKIIRNISQNLEISRILIIGDNIISLYSKLLMVFPKAHYYVANKTNSILKSFKEHYKNRKNYNMYILDVLKGVSIHDFIYNNPKLDLVIADKIYSKVKKKKRYYSINFLYKFYLNQDGILCLISNIQHSEEKKLDYLKPLKPIIEKIIPLKNEKTSVQFSFYLKKNKYS
jgi:hypothetical protein